MGVDDAMAVAWLLCQRERDIELLGVSAVWGNASVESATANVVALLSALGRSTVPVVAGATAPLHRPRTSVGALVHGPDGMWGRAAGVDASRATRDVVSFYASLPSEGATLLCRSRSLRVTRTELSRSPTWTSLRSRPAKPQARVSWPSQRNVTPA
jgi:hypothetical protein